MKRRYNSFPRNHDGWFRSKELEERCFVSRHWRKERVEAIALSANVAFKKEIFTLARIVEWQCQQGRGIVNDGATDEEDNKLKLGLARPFFELRNDDTRPQQRQQSACRTHDGLKCALANFLVDAYCLKQVIRIRRRLLQELCNPLLMGDERISLLLGARDYPKHQAARAFFHRSTGNNLRAALLSCFRTAGRRRQLVGP